MTWDWQSVTAIAVVGIAAGYLAFRVRALLRRKKSGGCASGCGHCEESTTEQDQSLVSIESLSEKAPARK